MKCQHDSSVLFDTANSSEIHDTNDFARVTCQAVYFIRRFLLSSAISNKQMHQAESSANMFVLKGSDRFDICYLRGEQDHCRTLG